ncbi:macro domain-containing protein [Ruegeria sp. Ofav3-42]|uniref:macro domain-containing protein n=1 Tax=Ruegeria sp. Ofav3-42 TaxID=2917759 RepID=UPI001EF47969|nr:macro domain-containing protein [Ruegeria sp. Ofav3-42]MCG7520758.1 macro domain-containing protein [Ruegeria sp. Ofav3-42]
MPTIKGDLIQLALDGEFDVIVHGCNCFHAMGAGIARVIAAEFPDALVADKQTEYGVRSKLGTVSTASVSRGTTSFVIVNAYTQFHWGGPGRLVDYDAISACFNMIARGFPTARIGYPMIGAGLAGGDWAEIAPRIDAALKDMDHKLVVLPG